MNEEITIRRAESVEDYRACQDAQRRAWGLTEEGYVVPVATMVGAQLHGGLVLGAFRPDGQAIGLSFAFLGRIEGRLCLYSQLTGVVPGFQGHGIGFRLKQAQWEYARSEGLELLAWAFDPLQAGNAHFNLEKLGATCSRYIENMYGLRTDALNAGVPTDRLIAEWSTTPRALRTIDPTRVENVPTILEVSFDQQARPLVIPHNEAPTAPRVRLEIPEQIQTLRQDGPALAEQWARAARHSFTTAFAAGYRAVGFLRIPSGEGRKCAYLLERS